MIYLKKYTLFNNGLRPSVYFTRCKPCLNDEKKEISEVYKKNQVILTNGKHYSFIGKKTNHFF